MIRRIPGQVVVAAVLVVLFVLALVLARAQGELALLPLDLTVDFLRASSYGSGTTSSTWRTPAGGATTPGPGRSWRAGRRTPSPSSAACANSTRTWPTVHT